ncbi:MAG: hypothetical protein V4577_11195 [Bacteroidota bacterium]
MFNSRGCCIILSSVIALVFSAFQIVPPRLDSIALTNEQLAIKPKEFYIANVIDELKNHGPVAVLITGAKGRQQQAYTADLKGGTVFAVRQFIANNLPRNIALRPIIIGLEKISIKETALANSRVDGHVETVFSFYSGNEEDKVHLGDYSGTADYNRDITQTQYIESALRKVLVNGLVYLNTWMDRQAATNIKLAKKVEVSFSDYADKTEGDSIYYSVKRPLTWADFSGKVPTSKYSAEVFPTLGYEQSAEVADGVIRLHITLKAALPKSAAWVKNESRSPYTLNHEQRHFDIVKIGAERFRRKLTNSMLLPDNYEGTVNVTYLDAYREMTDLQKQYDTETNHGLNTAEQERWNVKIDRELKELKVK